MHSTSWWEHTLHWFSSLISKTFRTPFSELEISATESILKCFWSEEKNKLFPPTLPSVLGWFGSTPILITHLFQHVQTFSLRILCISKLIRFKKKIESKVEARICTFQGSRKIRLCRNSPAVIALPDSLNPFRKFHVNSVASRALSPEIAPVWTAAGRGYFKSSLWLLFYLGSLWIEMGTSGTGDRHRTGVHTPKAEPAGAMAQLEGQGSCLEAPQRWHSVCCSTQATHQSCVRCSLTPIATAKGLNLELFFPA